MTRGSPVDTVRQIDKSHFGASDAQGKNVETWIR